KLEDAVEWIADRLPCEVAAQISHADVKRILQWHLDYFQGVGLASEYGEEVGGEVVPADAEGVVADDDAAVDYVVARAVEAGDGVWRLVGVCVLELQLKCLDAIGAIGPQAEGRPGGGNAGAGANGPSSG